MYMTNLCSYLFGHNKTYVDHLYETRNKTDRHLKIPVSYKSLNLKFANYIAPKVYNLLPSAIKNLSNIKVFNAECKRYIFGNYDKIR